MKIDVLRDTPDWDATVAEWDALRERVAPGRIFLSHAWLRTWWTHFGDGRDLAVCVTREGGRLVGGVALMRSIRRRRGVALRVWELVGTGLSDRLGILAEGDGSDFCEALVERLLDDLGPWDALDLRDLPQDDPSSQALASALEKRGIAQRLARSIPCPRFRVSGAWSDFYTAKISAKVRSNNRNKARRLAKEGAVEFRMATAPGEVVPAMDAIFALGEREKDRSKERLRPFDLPGGRAFFRDVGEALARRGALLLALLYVGERPVAYRVSFRSEGVHADYYPGFDPEFVRLSPGRLLLVHVLEDCFDSGVDEVDFLRGFEDWKGDWTDRVSWNAELRATAPGWTARARRFVHEPRKQARRAIRRR